MYEKLDHHTQNPSHCCIVQIYFFIAILISLLFFPLFTPMIQILSTGITYTVTMTDRFVFNSNHTWFQGRCFSGFHGYAKRSEGRSISAQGVSWAFLGFLGVCRGVSGVPLAFLGYSKGFQRVWWGVPWGFMDVSTCSSVFLWTSGVLQRIKRSFRSIPVAFKSFRVFPESFRSVPGSFSDVPGYSSGFQGVSEAFQGFSRGINGVLGSFRRSQ